MNQLAAAMKSAGQVRKCWPKEQKLTRGAAEAQMRSITARELEKDATTIHVYECPHCRYWHVGHGRAR